MKAKVLVAFTDLKNQTFRQIGETFEVEKERFDEINSAIYGCLEEVKAPAKAKKKAVKKDE